MLGTFTYVASHTPLNRVLLLCPIYRYRNSRPERQRACF